jgi:hypothetical protein
VCWFYTIRSGGEIVKWRAYPHFLGNTRHVSSCITRLAPRCAAMPEVPEVGRGASPTVPSGLSPPAP